MGIYYESTAVIGYRIKTDKFYEEVEVKSCDHTVDTKLKFCPECGTQNTTYKKRFEKYANPTDSESYYETFAYNEYPEGYVYNTLYDNDGDVCWFGYGATVDYHGSKMLPIKSYDEIKSEIQNIMKPFIDLNLIVLDDNEFGFWVIYTGH